MEDFKEDFIEFHCKLNQNLEECCEVILQTVWDIREEIFAKMCQLYENTVMEDEAEKNGDFTAVRETEVFPTEDFGLVSTQVTAVLGECYDYLKEDQVMSEKDNHVMWEFIFPFAENSVSLGAVGLLDLCKKLL